MIELFATREAEAALLCPHAGSARAQPARMAWAMTQPVRPVTPPCRHAISGRPARPRAIAARAGVLAGGIPAGQRKNAPPMYLGAGLCRERSPGSARLLGPRPSVLGNIRGAIGTAATLGNPALARC